MPVELYETILMLSQIIEHKCVVGSRETVPETIRTFAIFIHPRWTYSVPSVTHRACGEIGKFARAAVSVRTMVAMFMHVDSEISMIHVHGRDAEPVRMHSAPAH